MLSNNVPCAQPSPSIACSQRHKPCSRPLHYPYNLSTFKVESMMLWRLSLPRSKTIRNAISAGAALACLSAVTAYAEENPPAASAPAETSAAPPANSAKTAQPIAKPAKAKPALPAEPPECVRTGQRVITALARDDSGAATQFHKFYEAFKCPAPRLTQAFRCLVNLQTANPGLTNPTPEQVTQCWRNPATLPRVEAPKPSAKAPGEKQTQAVSKETGSGARPSHRTIPNS